MAFCFKRKEPVPKAIRRLGRERIEHAFECLKECARPAAFHSVRKDIKKARAVLRLVRTRIPKKDFRRLTRLLREAAVRLAPPRDAFVKAKTLRDLARHYRNQLGPQRFRRVRTDLEKEAHAEMKRFAKKKTVRAIQRSLRGGVKKLKRLDVGGNGWITIRPGIKTAHSQGQRAYHAVLKDPSPENLHEWRKRVKDLWYHVTLLRQLWPEQMDAMARELEVLGKYLGDDHDLVVLRETAEKRCAADDAGDELETLYRLIEQRRRELRAEALALGKRFYAEKSPRFCNRLAGYWQTWQRQNTETTANRR